MNGKRDALMKQLEGKIVLIEKTSDVSLRVPCMHYSSLTVLDQVAMDFQGATVLAKFPRR